MFDEDENENDEILDFLKKVKRNFLCSGSGCGMCCSTGNGNGPCGSNDYYT